jgi:hypothetical protein
MLESARKNIMTCWESVFLQHYWYLDGVCLRYINRFWGSSPLYPDGEKRQTLLVKWGKHRNYLDNQCAMFSISLKHHISSPVLTVSLLPNQLIQGQHYKLNQHTIICVLVIYSLLR